MAVIGDLVGMVRNSIRDNGSPQAFPDVDTGIGPVTNNSPELTQFVVASIAEYSRYRPLRRPFSLNLLTGVTAYPLPTDWIAPDLVAFNDAVQPHHVPDPLAYMLPYITIAAPLGAQQNTLEFEWYNDLQQVVLTVPPVANYSIAFAYFANHQSGVSGPCTVPAQWLDIALAPACERALRAIATDQTVKLQQYRLANGKLEVDNRTIKDALLKQADEWHMRFRQEVVLRPVAMSG